MAKCGPRACFWRSKAARTVKQKAKIQMLLMILKFRFAMILVFHKGPAPRIQFFAGYFGFIK